MILLKKHNFYSSKIAFLFLSIMLLLSCATTKQQHDTSNNESIIKVTTIKIQGNKSHCEQQYEKIIPIKVFLSDNFTYSDQFEIKNISKEINGMYSYDVLVRFLGRNVYKIAASIYKKDKEPKKLIDLAILFIKSPDFAVMSRYHHPEGTSVLEFSVFTRTIQKDIYSQ